MLELGGTAKKDHLQGKSMDFNNQSEIRKKSGCPGNCRNHNLLIRTYVTDTKVFLGKHINEK